MRFHALPVGFALVLGTGCGTSAQRGAALYGEGRYIEAAEVFERTEAQLPGCDGDERAEYGLYRGLTFLALDDLRGAGEWLSYAASVERKAPGRLSEEQLGALTRALAEVDRRAKAQPDAPPSPLDAVASEDDAPRGAPTNGRRSVRE